MGASTAGDFLAEGNPTSQVGGNNTNRYSSKSLYKTSNTKTIRSEIGSTCSIVNFKLFKDRFSGGNHARGFGGASKIFSAQLATNYTRSCPLRHGSGLQARVDLAPDSKQNQGPSSFFTHRIRENRHRNYRSLGQRGIEQGRAGFRPVSKQYFLGSKAGWEIATGDQPNRFERSQPIRSFQNGRHPPSARSASASRLAGEDRPKGCLLGDSNLERTQEVSSLCLEEYTPRVCMPSFWAVGCPTTVHKGDETSRCSSSPSRDTSDNIPGRSFVHESIQGRPTTRNGYSTVPLRFRFCDKFRDVVFHANSDIRVSRVSSKHSGYDSTPARLQGGSDKSRLQRPDSTSRGVSQGTISAKWEADHLHTGYFPCPLALPSSTTSETPSPSPSPTQGLRRDFSPIKRSGGGATLVASPPERLERTGDSTPFYRLDNRNGRVNEGLGRGVSRGKNRGAVVF